MINANSWIIVDFDEKGKNDIETTIKTLEELIESIGKICGTNDQTDAFNNALDYLKAIANNEPY